MFGWAKPHMDAAKQRRLTEEERETIRQLFRAIDVDGGGTIDIEEFMQLASGAAVEKQAAAAARATTAHPPRNRLALARR